MDKANGHPFPPSLVDEIDAWMFWAQDLGTAQLQFLIERRCRAGGPRIRTVKAWQSLHASEIRGVARQMQKRITS